MLVTVPQHVLHHGEEQHTTHKRRTDSDPLQTCSGFSRSCVQDSGHQTRGVFLTHRVQQNSYKMHPVVERRHLCRVSWPVSGLASVNVELSRQHGPTLQPAPACCHAIPSRGRDWQAHNQSSVPCCIMTRPRCIARSRHRAFRHTARSPAICRPWR